MMGLDSTTLLLFLVPPLLGFIFNAVKFTRFIGFVAGGGKESSQRGRSYYEQMSFDSASPSGFGNLSRSAARRADDLLHL
jgi:hypothetical protein